MATLVIRVRLEAGAYVTNTHKGVKASCTSDAHRAAEAFGRKWFGDPNFLHAELLPVKAVLRGREWQQFRIHGKDATE